MPFTYPFCYTPRPEIVAASQRLTARIDADPALQAFFAEGKMLGVLMVEAPDGSTDYLYAFSGLAGGRNRVEGFVPPIYDLLDPEGHFKQEEAAIVALTRRIQALRGEGNAPDDECRALFRERRERSIALQEWIFEQFIVHNARGESLSIAEVFARRGLVPPGGTGECAAPKLLEHAYRNGLKPLALGEFWYGASPEGELRRAGSFYPACTGKCGPLLAFMLEGLEVEPDPLQGPGIAGNESIEVLYVDESILVIDKPSGVLSVPGRTRRASVPALLQSQYGTLYSCHRLDMDTSGLMVYARTPEDQASLQTQFAERTVRKTYRARLSPALIRQDERDGTADGRPLSLGDRGRIDLPIAQDWYDRPRQKVDPRNGKQSQTEYEVLAVFPDGTAEVRFTPLTGRTHQLRVHAAHPDGLGRPILGDRLYGGQTTSGKNDGEPSQMRATPDVPLQLRADSLSFRHPRNGEELTFRLEA